MLLGAVFVLGLVLCSGFHNFTGKTPKATPDVWDDSKDETQTGKAASAPEEPDNTVSEVRSNLLLRKAGKHNLENFRSVRCIFTERRL